MFISRRDFLKFCGLSAGALGLNPSELKAIGEVLASPNAPIVIWLQGSGDNGCSISLLNRIAATAPKTVDELITDTIALIFHPNIMAAAGSQAVEAVRSASKYILVAEGAVPTIFDGKACTIWSENGEDVSYGDALSSLAPKAAAVISVGQCACFGGIGASGGNPTGLVSVSQFLGIPTINIAGCPAHPDWVIGTVAQLLAGTEVPLDSYGRPISIYGSTVHDLCPRNGMTKATKFGEEGCLMDLGCRGPETYANCPVTRWNNGVNWCVEANALCTGCTNPDFPTAASFYYGGY